MSSPQEQLKDLREGQVKTALDSYKNVHSALKTAHLKLAAATAKKEPQLIDFEARALREFTKKLGTIVDEVDEAVGMLDEFAEDPKLEAARDDAAKLVHSLGVVRKELAHWLEKADQLLALADKTMSDAVKRGGNLEAAWAGVRAKVAAAKKSVDGFDATMEKVMDDALAAGKALDGSKLAAAKDRAKDYGGGIADEFVKDAASQLAAFDKALATLKPSAAFKAVYTRERQRVAEMIDDMRETAKGLLKSYINISVMEMQFNFRKIAEALGMAPADAAKLAPALSQNDSAKLKALDAASKKHNLGVPAKDLLATLQKRGLVGRA